MRSCCNFMNIIVLFFPFSAGRSRVVEDFGPGGPASFDMSKFLYAGTCLAEG